MADEDSETGKEVAGWAPPAAAPIGGVVDAHGKSSTPTKRRGRAIAVALGVGALVLAGLAISRAGDDGDTSGGGSAGGLLNDLGVDQARAEGTTTDVGKASIEASGVVLGDEFGFERSSDAVILSSDDDKENQYMTMELCDVTEKVSDLDGVAYQTFEGDVGHHQAFSGIGFGDEGDLREWAEKAYDLALTFRDDPANCAIAGTDGATLVGEPTVDLEKTDGAVASIVTFHLEDDGNLLQVGLVIVHSGDWAYLSAVSIDEANAMPDAEFGASLRRVIFRAIATIQG